MSWILHSFVACLLLGVSIQQQTQEKRPNYVTLTDGLTGRQKTFVERRCQYMQRKINYATQKVTVPCVQNADGTVQANRYPVYGDGLVWRQCEQTIQRPYFSNERVDSCCPEWQENADGLCVIPDNNSRLPMLCNNGGIPEKYNGVIRCLCHTGFYGFVCEKTGEYPTPSYYTDVNKQMEGAMEGAVIRGQMWKMLTAMFQKRRMAMFMSEMNNRLNSNPQRPPLPNQSRPPYIPNERTPVAEQRAKSFSELLSSIYSARLIQTFIKEHPELRDQILVLLASKLAADKRRQNTEQHAMQIGYKIRNLLLDRKRKYAIAINKLNQLVSMKKTMMAKAKAEMMNKIMQSRQRGVQYTALYGRKQRMMEYLRRHMAVAMRQKFALILRYKLLQNLMANRPVLQKFVQKLQQNLSNGMNGAQQEDNDDDKSKDQPNVQNCVTDFDSSFNQCFVNFGLDPEKALQVTQGIMYGRISATEETVAIFRAVCSQQRNIESCLNTPVESCQKVPTMAYVSNNIYRIFRVLDRLCQHVPQTPDNGYDDQSGVDGPGNEDVPDATCQNGGEWLFVEDRYVCRCPDGFSGTYCEYDAPADDETEQPMDSQECQNGGQLLGVEDVCTCLEGFSGRYCEVVETVDGNDAPMLDNEMPPYPEDMNEDYPYSAMDENINDNIPDQAMPVDPSDQLPPIDELPPMDELPPIVPDIMPDEQMDQPGVDYPDMPGNADLMDSGVDVPLEETAQRQRGPYFTNCPTDIITLTIPSDSSVARLPFQLDARDWLGTPLQWGISRTGFQWSSHSIETVIATARDEYGRLAKCVFSVTVTDPYGPTFKSCPQDITVATDKEPVIWPEIEAADNVGLLSQPKGDHKSGSTFPVGRTLVTFVAEDLAGNIEYCKFLVNVEKSGDVGSSEKEVIRPKLEGDVIKPIASKSSSDNKNGEPVSPVTSPRVDTMMIAMLSVAVGVLIIAIVTAIIACVCLKKRKKVWVIEKKPGEIPAIATTPPEYETKGIPPMFYEEAKGETLKGEGNQETESSKI